VKKPNGKGIWAGVMEIEKPGMNIWVVVKGPVSGIPVVIIIEGLWVKGNGEFPFFKQILPLLGIKNVFYGTFRIKELARVKFVRRMSNND